jgi:hypothetical protein
MGPFHALNPGLMIGIHAPTRAAAPTNAKITAPLSYTKDLLTETLCWIQFIASILSISSTSNEFLHFLNHSDEPVRPLSGVNRPPRRPPHQLGTQRITQDSAATMANRFNSFRSRLGRLFSDMLLLEQSDPGGFSFPCVFELCHSFRMLKALDIP